MQRRVKQADIHIHAAPGGACADDAGDQGEGRHQPGHHIHNGKTKARRWAIRFAGQGKIARFRLHQIIIARPGFARSLPAIGRKMRADDARVDVLQRVKGQAKLIRLITAQIIQNRIRMTHQLA